METAFGNYMGDHRVISSILTVAYGLRFWWGAFSPKKDLEDTAVDREAWQMFLPPALLAAGGLAAGLIPGLGERLLAPYANSYPDGDAGHLTLWGGFGLPLLLTVGVLALGAALFLAPAHVKGSYMRAM